tara:strand:+ start:23043 stop:24077 length:1035 start_codon:yes stop_codon:yes gene_type:complete
MLTQFTAAFDDCFLYRYTKDKRAKEKISVRYVMGPKNRVLYDIINQAKNITLPVISMEQTNIRRDPSRIQHKDQKLHRPNLNNTDVSNVPSPIPVIMDVNVSIVANYKEDVDQIVSNFIPWCNPYFIIAWKVPEDFGMDFVDELRSEVSWGGTVDFENPTNIDNTDKYKIVGNTTFTIKGWIFPALETPSAPIYVVNPNFISVNTGADLSDYKSLSTNDTTDVIFISAYPEITNTFYNGLAVYDNMTIAATNTNNFTLYGKRFGFNNSWYLSGEYVAPLILEEINTFKFPTISAYKLPDDLITVIDDNIATISLSSNYLSAGDFTIVTSNSAGWVAWDKVATVI